MMDTLFEQRVIQNPMLAAEALWEAAYGAYESKERAEGVELPLIFLVLPMSFHRRTALGLATRSQPGAIYKALADDREIVIGLQERMAAMSSKTFDALSIAFHSGLLELDTGHRFQVLPGRKTKPVTHVTEDAKVVLGAAKRVGQALAEMSPEQLSAHLHVRF
jgi:hypothetical protein